MLEKMKGLGEVKLVIQVLTNRISLYFPGDLNVFLHLIKRVHCQAFRCKQQTVLVHVEQRCYFS